MSTKLLIVVVTINAVFGQLILKYAIRELGGLHALESMWKFVAEALTSPWVYASVFIQGLGYFLWMILLSREKIGVATASVGAGFYILTPLCAWAIFGESLSVLQWLGIGLLTVGVTCVGVGQS